MNFAVIRHSGYNILRADQTRGSLAPSAESASEPASIHSSGPSSSPLNNLRFCPDGLYRLALRRAPGTGLRAIKLVKARQSA